ncbi:TetR/AcrR family transcriptional regulator [Xanthobacter oligotrophicus]|uniref:TetR/AcrR family transcriptional regulator n=1 Tax=Xanthobacter oligotrophicus TaxID=2607286 RepID=UPI0011F3AC4F|nr:TetR/AcrR family transcriptional regulator [Xanthobacter oligotrophicus]MCG5234880.1 TetR/AcrR family transcriptional regulator [Xanthobacter oligotrophicus]
MGADERAEAGETHAPRPDALEAHSLEALSARIHARHRDLIKVQKPHVAVANLARIIDAALKLSNRHGFHAMTLRQLAAESGLSMGGLYSYLDSKDTLLLMILGEVSHAVEAELGSAPEAMRADPAAHLNWLIAAHVRLSEAMHAWFVFAYMEAKAFPPEARKRAIDSERLTERIFADVIAQGLRQGVFSADDPLFAATLIKPLLQDWYVKRSKYRERGIDAATYAAQVTRFVEGALAVRGRGEAAAAI